MTEYKYNDIIEYIDCTFDENFEDAKRWCKQNNAQLQELVERRQEKTFVEEYEEKDAEFKPQKATREVKKLYRYFQIVENPTYELTEDELKQQVRELRNIYLTNTDFTQLNDAPFSDEEKAAYARYRNYLRDYTKNTEWWLNNPKTFEEWVKLISGDE